MDKSLKFLSKFNKCYFISPHLDDSIYSCSSLIRKLSYLKKCEVITIFTSDPDITLIDQLNFGFFIKEKRIRAFPKLRRKEDISACKMVGASYTHLNFTDAISRSGFKFNQKNYVYNSSNPKKFHMDSMELLFEIERSLKSIINKSNLDCFFLPLGIGNHIDHIITNLSLKNLMKGDNLFYYEDFPYNTLTKDIDRARYKSIFSVKYDKNKLNDLLNYESQIVPIFNNVHNLKAILRKQKYEYYYTKK
jgi:LmbE family N-acetylglucosaminyl deacetylase